MGRRKPSGEWRHHPTMGSTYWCSRPCGRGHVRCSTEAGGECFQPEKRAPRGVPFKKENDPRRLQEQDGTPKTRTEGEAMTKAGDTCPTCKEGTLVAKTGKFGAFIGCSRYPVCRFSRKATDDEQRAKGEHDGELKTSNDEYDTDEPDDVGRDAGRDGEKKGEGKGKAKGEGEGEGEQGEGEGDGDGDEQGEAKEQKQSARDKRGDEDVFTKRQLERIGEIADEADEVLAKAVAQAFKKFAAQRQDEQRQRIEVEVKQGDETTKSEIEGEAHPLMVRVLRKALRGQNIMLVGPAGCGKTYLAAQVAQALPTNGGLPGVNGQGRFFASVSCTAGMTESQLTGRYIPTGERGVYLTSEFVRCFELGGVFLLDEFDAADANVVLVLNQALANGRLPLPNRVDNPVAVKHPDFVCMIAANTFGRGADRMYVGRNQLDAATLDRFVGGYISMDYDRALEERLAVEALGKAKAAPVLKQWWTVREKAAGLKLRQVVSTRGLLAVVAMLQSGEHDTPVAAVRDALESWPAEDRVKVGVAA